MNEIIYKFPNNHQNNMIILLPLVITDTTYAGEAASAFIVAAVMGNDTVNSGIVYIKDGIKKQHTIKRIDVQDIVQDRAATPTSQGDMNVDGRILIPEDYMVYIEFNPRDFEEHWDAIKLSPELLDRALPATAESYLIQQILKRHDEYAENAVWTSVKNSATPYKYFDGFIQKLTNDPDTIIIAAPVTLTEANIFDKLKLIKTAVPKPLKKNKNLKYLVSYATKEIYENALQALNSFIGTRVEDSAQMKYSGKDIVPLAGMPDDTIIACVCTPGMDSNLWIGMNSLGDDTKIELKQLQANSELWFIKMLFKLDVQIGWPSECVLYNV